MIIFGTRGVTTSPESGSFHCPSCGLGSPFKWKRVRNFFTLYFIPLIPLNKIGEYIECQRCKGTYNTEILSYDPQKHALEIEAQYQTTMRQVMISMLLADGTVDNAEIRELQAIFAEMTGRQLDDTSLRQEISQIQSQGGNAIQSLTAVAGVLNDHGKEKVIEGAYRIAAADGTVAPEEQQLLGKIAEMLGLSAAHFKGLMATLMSGERIGPPATGQIEDNRPNTPPPLPG
ncbi:MAG: TerB family tellurite resistance protein [Verrucomicrobiae bacterium]|nr:TerB family tellurite resistance protein [Verrucomicrobiae bacterium]